MNGSSRNAILSIMDLRDFGGIPFKMLNMKRAVTDEANDIKASVRTAHGKPATESTFLKIIWKIIPPVVYILVAT